MPICTDCRLTDHKQPEHQYERIADIEAKQIEEMENLIAESKNKVTFCEAASHTLENGLSELQMQRDNVKGLIQETFQSYKAILEKRQVCCIDEVSMNLVGERNRKWKVV